MSEYQRPRFPVATYLDEQGAAIDYGNRWEDAPPDEAYSRVSNPQRFAPLHAVALTLIEWLQDTFDVTTERGSKVAADLLRAEKDNVDAIRIVPSGSNEAPLTFVLTPFPGVFLHAGSLHDFHFPDCGCDACDEDVEAVAAELEWTVRTVVSGGYSERFDSWPARWIESRLEDSAGSRAGRTRTRELPENRVAQARLALPPDGSWTAWTPLAH